VPTTTIDIVTGGIMISWVMPFHNGMPIIAYQIEILNINGLWQSDISCNGAS
jgi:hypothetical protein